MHSTPSTTFSSTQPTTPVRLRVHSAPSPLNSTPTVRSRGACTSSSKPQCKIGQFVTLSKDELITCSRLQLHTNQAARTNFRHDRLGAGVNRHNLLSGRRGD